MSARVGQCDFAMVVADQRCTFDRGHKGDHFCAGFAWSRSDPRSTGWWSLPKAETPVTTITVDLADLRAVVEFAEEVHSKGDPICDPATRLLAVLEGDES